MDLLCGDDAEIEAREEWCGGSALAGELDHARGDVAGEDADVAGGEMDGVDAGTAIEFEEAVARVEAAVEFLPDGVAPKTADEGGGEVALVGFGGGVPVCLGGGEFCGGERHGGQ